MLFWISAVLLLYLLQIYLSALAMLPAIGVATAFGSRDTLPDRGRIAGRAERALVNMKENLPFFIVPSVLAYLVEGVDLEAAAMSVQVFFWARLAFVGIYLTGLPWARSPFFALGLASNLYCMWLVLTAAG
ncbi:MAPEG family protein [Roseibium sp.]|uniref:MAPEG family protein n=1 Tax=Roseibium sp. TaxID=1936156 RepID=UPI003A983330